MLCGSQYQANTLIHTQTPLSPGAASQALSRVRMPREHAAALIRPDLHLACFALSGPTLRCRHQSRPSKLARSPLTWPRMDHLVVTLRREVKNSIAPSAVMSMSPNFDLVP